MNIEPEIVKRFEYLIQQGKNIERSFFQDGYMEVYRDSSLLRLTWINQVQTLLENATDNKSRHIESLKKILTPTSNDGYIRVLYEHNVDSGVIRTVNAILLEAEDSYKNGDAFKLRQRLQVDMFSDLLDQAEQYLQSNEEKHRGIAAIIAGCVLEDSMRKLCERHGVELKRNPTMPRMLPSLAKVLDISNPSQKAIDAYIALRDSAAHGKWKECSDSQVRSMIEFVSNEFLAKYFEN